MYDLLLKGGTLVDPSRNVHEKLDVGITGDRVTGLSDSIGASEATRVIDVSGKLITPGLVEGMAFSFVPAGLQRRSVPRRWVVPAVF